MPFEGKTYSRRWKLTHMFSINPLQTPWRSLGYVYRQSIQFPLCSAAPNDSHRLWGMYSTQPVDRNKRFFLISEDEQVCRRPPPLETLISPPLLWGAVQCWQSCLEPNLHDCFTSCLPSCYGLWSSRWHEVAPCSYYWYQSPWKEKITLADESWLASESQRRDSFDSHENPRTHFQQTCKNTLRFPLFFDAGKRRGFNLPSVWIWKRCFMELSDAHSSALACLLLEVLGPGWTKE